MFNQTISNAKTLYRAQVRSVDGQPATFHVGEKYPVITQQYAGSVPAGQQARSMRRRLLSRSKIWAPK